jgi:hypothetical protein
MPQNGMPLKKKDPFDTIVEIVLAGDNVHEIQQIQYLREALLQLATECKLLAIGQSNMAGHLQDHIGKPSHE